MRGGRYGEQCREAAGRAPAAHQAVQPADQHADAGGERRVPGGGEQPAHREFTGRETDSGHRQYGDLEQGHDHGGLCGGTSLDPPHPVALGAEPRQRLQDAGLLAAGRACGRDRTGAAHRLHEACGDLALALLVARDAVAGLSDEGFQQQDEQRHADEERPRRPQVDESEGDEPADGCHDGGHRARERGRGAPAWAALPTRRATTSPGGSGPWCAGRPRGPCRSRRGGTRRWSGRWWWRSARRRGRRGGRAGR